MTIERCSRLKHWLLFLFWTDVNMSQRYFFTELPATVGTLYIVVLLYPFRQRGVAFWYIGRFRHLIDL